MQGESDLQAQAGMVDQLQRALETLHGAAQRFETHISWVLVCGATAHKIKKALRNPFLDQSTLALRQRACDEELRLNRRLAPDLYLAVVPITGTAAAPMLGGQGAAIDFAVQMRAFAQDGLWDRLAARGALEAWHIDELVRALVPFHATAAVAERAGRLGSPVQVRAPLLASLGELGRLVGAGAGSAALRHLSAWEAAAFDGLRPVMAQRLAQGCVRECHGDLHLGNVTVVNGRTTVFDGVEFNDDFRWIDVMSEVAFMTMDLHAHGLSSLAHRFINGYLEQCGDYEGGAVLNYYMVHRALVRAKVELLRARQRTAAQAAAAAADGAAAHRYIELALQFSQRSPASAWLFITHGYSGSGKSTLTQGLLEEVGALRIRADVERKRLAGLGPLDRSGGQPAAALYRPDKTTATYARLARLASAVLQGGYPALLDATFLQRAQRDAARQLAARQGVRCIILDFDADPALLRQRLRQRAATGLDPSDADEAVLAAQMQCAEPLTLDELAVTFRCPVAVQSANGAVQADWARLLDRIAARDGAPAAGSGAPFSNPTRLPR